MVIFLRMFLSLFQKQVKEIRIKTTEIIIKK